MLDIEEKDETTASLHAQRSKLAKGRQGLVRTRHSLVLLSSLWVSHVAEDRSVLGHLFERAIVLVELFFSLALAGLESVRLPRTGASRSLRNDLHGIVAPRPRGIDVVSLWARMRSAVGC
jgi:hypothetical protein